MALILALLAASPGPSWNLKEQVESLVWTKRGTLVAVTGTKAVELSSGRSRPLRRYSGEIDDPIRRAPGRLLLDASCTRAIGTGFVLDLKTLASKPIEHAATWEGDRFVELSSPTLGHYSLRANGHRRPLAPGWFVLGVSRDLRLGLACRKDPEDGDTTYLLRLDTENGRPTVAATYPNTSDDHSWLSYVEELRPGGPTLINRHDLALDVTRDSYVVKPDLRPIGPPTPETMTQIGSLAEWIETRAGRVLLWRSFMLDGAQGADVWTLDLLDPRTGAMKRLVKSTDYWTDRDESTRGDGPLLGAYAIDWPHRRLAYVIDTKTNHQVFIKRI